MKWKLPSSVLLTMYINFIRPLLEYGDVIWDNVTSMGAKLSSKLESLQYNCLLIVSGCTYGTNMEKLRLMYGLNSMKFRRKMHRMTTIYKILNDENTPDYLKDLIIDRPNKTFSSRLEHLPVPKSSTQFHRNSFLPNSIVEWNALAKDIRNSPSLLTFKLNYSKRYGVPEKLPLVTIHNRHHEIILNKFRANFTSLKADMKRHNYSECSSDLCDCGQESETHYHYFYVCTNYSSSRIKLFNTFKGILLKPITALIKLAPKG